MFYNCTLSFEQWELGIFPLAPHTHVFYFGTIFMHLPSECVQFKDCSIHTLYLGKKTHKKTTNKQSKDCVCQMRIFYGPCFLFFPGDIYEEEIWVNEEGLWAECSVWLWDCSDHLQQHQQTVPVCQHWHGQSVAEIHRVQWATWESNEFGYCWGKVMCSLRILFFTLLWGGGTQRERPGQLFSGILECSLEVT